MGFLPSLIFIGSPTLLILWYLRYLWVYNVRTDLFNANADLYDRLPTYSVMISRFWIWDATKFIDYGIRHGDHEKKLKEKSKRRGEKITARYLGIKDR